MVAAFLAPLDSSSSSARLLHGGTALGSSHWQGDVDLLVTSDRDTFLEETHAAAASLGFSAILQMPRVFNTLEVDLVFGAARSWTAVFVDQEGRVIHLDLVFALGARQSTPSGPAAFGLPEVDPATASTYLILKRLRKGDRGADSWAEISRRAGSSAPELRRYLGARVGRRVQDAVQHGIAPGAKTVAQARRAMRVRRARSPAFFGTLARAGRAAARRSSRPVGVFVSLSGVDGSGKSAVSQGLMDWSPFRRARRLHARPGVLKPMGWFVGRPPSDGADPHGSRQWGPGMSVIRLAYYWADFVFGYWTRIWPVRARGGIVVSERWWWDMYVDPERHRIQPMPRAARSLGRFVPGPDLFLLLDAPSSCIRDRKRELTAPEIERQRKAWTDLSGAIANLERIDARPPLPDVTGEVIRAVVDHQGRRIASDPRLVAFPRRSPRWLVDPEDSSSMGAALRMYMPSRRRAVAVARGVEILRRRTHLGAPIIRCLGGDVSPEAADAIDWIREAAERHTRERRLRVTAYLGSPGPRQKVSALVLDRAGHPVLFAKVATSAEAVEAVRNEAEVLQSIGPAAGGAALPQVVAFETGRRGAILLSGTLVGSRLGNRAAADDRHLRLVADLLTRRRPLDGAAHGAAVRKRLERAPDSEQARFLRSAMRSVGGIWGAIGSTHFAHGDLTPWNCLNCGNVLGVVDWETAGYRLPGWDPLHYVVQIEAITRTGSVGRAADRALRSAFLVRSGDLVVGASDIGLPPSERWEAVQILVLLESAAELLTTQPHLYLRGISVRTHAVARVLGMTPPGREP